MAKISNEAARNSLNTINSLLNAGGAATIEVYTGNVPATAETSTGTSPIATLTMSEPAFAGATDNIANNRAEMAAGQGGYEIADDTSAAGAGAPTYVRLVAGNGNPVAQLTAAVAGSAEVNFAAEISIGSSVSISSLTMIQSEI